MSMSGRVVLITGGAQGMGRITALALAGQGAHVIIADWNGEHAERTVAEIRNTTGGSAEYLYCNLASNDSVHALADAVLARHPALHVLINNAGITYPHRQLNAAGIDMHLATCHLGHFLLTHLLLERLRASAPARVLFVASEGHKACKGLDFDDFNNEALWRGRAVNHGAGFMAYARAKLAMIHTMRGFARQLEGSGITVNALSPGFFVNTGIHREMRGVFRLGAQLVFGLGSLFGLNTPERGARTHIWLASADEAGACHGRYLEHCREKPMCPHADDEAERTELWRRSRELTGLTT